MTEISKKTQEALLLLGSLIQKERLVTGTSQLLLAERLGVSRQTVASLEKGDPRVAIGTVFEAAVTLGIPLLAEDSQQIKQSQQLLANLEGILPKRAGDKGAEIDDDF
jgi:transcriptional regulator with XRE-family HTH domain